MVKFFIVVFNAKKLLTYNQIFINVLFVDLSPTFLFMKTADREIPKTSSIIYQLNIHAIYEIISVLELHHDHSFLQTKYDLNDDVMINFFSAVVKLSSFKTEKGKSRINSTSRSNLLQPAKLRSHAEQNEFSRLVPKFEVFSEVEIDEFEFLSRYYFFTQKHLKSCNSI